MDSIQLVRGIIGSPEFCSLWGISTANVPDLCVMTDAPGLRYWFHLRDQVIGQRIAENNYERPITAVVTRLATPGSTVLDVGANLGYFSVLMGSLGCTVHAFEPFPDNFALLTRNIRENNLANVTAHQIAAHSETRNGKLYFRDDDRNENYGSMFTSSDPQDKHLTSIDVRYARLDDLLHGLGPVTFVKIDVEGAEIHALNGMAEILKRDKPSLVIELNEYALLSANRHTPHELLLEIDGLGYQVFDAETEKPYRFSESSTQYIYANLLCLPRHTGRGFEESSR